MTTAATPPGHYTSTLEFETGQLEASAALDPMLEAAHDLEITPDTAHVLGLPTVMDGPIAAQSKTMSFTGKLFAGGMQAATLDNATVTVTRMGNPTSGVAMLFITFAYEATSLQWRSGRGAPGEPLGMSHGLFFKNQAGGTMYSWGFPHDDFRLDCGWNHQPRYHVIREYTFVDWFDLWQGVEHRVQGAMFRC